MPHYCRGDCTVTHVRFLMTTASAPIALQAAHLLNNDITAVVICETGVLRSGQTFEMGPVGVILFRTSALPPWAHAISYDRGELHIDEDEGSECITELKQLIQDGAATIVRNSRFVHAVSPFGQHAIGL